MRKPVWSRRKRYVSGSASYGSANRIPVYHLQYYLVYIMKFLFWIMLGKGIRSYKWWLTPKQLTFSARKIWLELPGKLLSRTAAFIAAIDPRLFHWALALFGILGVVTGAASPYNQNLQPYILTDLYQFSKIILPVVKGTLTTTFPIIVLTSKRWILYCGKLLSIETSRLD